MSVPKLTEGQLFAEHYRVGRPLDEGDPPRAFLVQREGAATTQQLELFEPDPEKRARILAILRRAALLEGPFVDPLIEVGVEGETPWMIISTSDEETLAAYLARRGKLTGPEVCAVVYQMSGVLASARARGLRPVDVAPDHFIVVREAAGEISPSLRYRAGALARFLIEWDRAASTLKTTWSTWSWMAHELLALQPEASITPAFEARPLGLVAFQALTGQSFWTGTTPMEIMREALAEHPPPATQRAAAVGAQGALPPAFDAWFARCIARDPSDRFATAAIAEQSFQDLFAPCSPPIVGNPKGVHYDDGLQGVLGPGMSGSEGAGGPYREPGPGSIHVQRTEVILGNPKGSYYDGGHFTAEKPSRSRRSWAIAIVVIALVGGVVAVLRGMHR